ncbi:MAG TPA: SAM-dependent methyltransferase [Myxococcales bacterium]|nr:SAM-dependent methyltransferase [Myxococcales bacterium]
MTDRNPQAAQMVAESMTRTLAAQVRCIWPQEQTLFARYGEPQRILDVGCGTGEFAARLAERFERAQIYGVDVEASHLTRAAQRCAKFGSRMHFTLDDAYALQVAPSSFDLVVCRHVLQALPQPERVVTQCRRALRPGGWIHLLVEDYGMIHIDGPPVFDHFWLDGPVRYGEAISCDARIGRRGLALIDGMDEARLDVLQVDTHRVNPEDLAAVFEAWRDGYAEVLAPHLGWPLEKVVETMDAMIQATRTRYALWQVPVASGRQPLS